MRDIRRDYIDVEETEAQDERMNRLVRLLAIGMERLLARGGPEFLSEEDVDFVGDLRVTTDAPTPRKRRKTWRHWQS